MAIRSADAIRSRVAAANDHNMFPGRPQFMHLVVSSDPAILEKQEIHRKVNPVKIAPRDG